jgi:hypothetical protein
VRSITRNRLLCSVEVQHRTIGLARLRHQTQGQFSDQIAKLASRLRPLRLSMWGCQNQPARKMIAKDLSRSHNTPWTSLISDAYYRFRRSDHPRGKGFLLCRACKVLARYNYSLATRPRTVLILLDFVDVFDFWSLPSDLLTLFASPATRSKVVLPQLPTLTFRVSAFGT